MAIYNCEMCKYGTDNKAHYAIHCASKRHCQLVGTTYEEKPKVTKKVFTDVMQDITKYNQMKKVDMDIQADTFMREITALKQQIKHQDELNKMKEQMNLLKEESFKAKEDMYNRIIVDKDKMIDYLMNKEVSQVIPQYQAPQYQLIQAPQVAPQVASQVAPQVAPQVEPQVAPQVAPQVKAKEDPDDDVLNKSYLKKYCTMDSVNFCKNIEIIDADYQLFMEGEYVPMKRLMCQILERELKRMTLHEMGVVVLPNDKIYTYIDEWTESSKGLQDIRTWISKQLQLFLIEDPVYENIQYVTDDDFKEYKPTIKQADQYKDGTEVILQLQEERHEIDKELRAILKHYSTK